MINSIKNAPWKYGKKWVYSVTFDEALSDLHRYVIPICQKYGVPGHLEAVSSQLGQIRKLGNSSYNGMRHMDAKEMREMISMGWGVGSHSHTHGRVMDNPDDELGLSKRMIEEAIGQAVTLYVAPGNNHNLTKEVRDVLPSYGYNAGFGITDRINKPVDDMLFLGRVPLHERYWGDFDGTYDAYKRLTQASNESGWVVDYCHCPLPQAVHDYKDCTSDHFEQRLKAVVDTGEQKVWLANPDEVVDYMLTSRYMSVVEDKQASHENRKEYTLTDLGLPDTVINTSLTLLVDTWLTPESIRVVVENREQPVTPLEKRTLCFTVTAKPGLRITIMNRSEHE